MTDISATAATSYQGRKVLRTTRLSKPAPLKRSVSVRDSDYSSQTITENPHMASVVGRRACRILKLKKPSPKSAKVLDQIDLTEKESSGFDTGKRLLFQLSDVSGFAENDSFDSMPETSSPTDYQDWDVLDESSDVLSHDQKRLRSEYLEQSNNNNVTGLQIRKNDFWTHFNRSQQHSGKMLESENKFGYDILLPVTVEFIADKCHKITSIGDGLGSGMKQDDERFTLTADSGQGHNNDIMDPQNSENGDKVLTGDREAGNLNSHVKVIELSDSNNNFLGLPVASRASVSKDGSCFKSDASLCNQISGNAASAALLSLAIMKRNPRSESDCSLPQTYVNWTSANNGNYLKVSELLSTSTPDEGFSEQEYSFKLADDLTDHLSNISIHAEPENLFNSCIEMSVQEADSATTDPATINNIETESDLLRKGSGMCIYDSDGGDMYLKENKLSSRQLNSMHSYSNRVASMNICTIRLPLAPTSTHKEIQKAEEGGLTGMNTARGRRRLFNKYNMTRTNAEIETVAERRLYSAEELLKLGVLPESKLKPDSWIYLTKIYPDVCLSEVPDYFDTLQYLEERSHVTEKHNVWKGPKPTWPRKNPEQPKSEMRPVKPVIRGVGFGVPKAVISKQ